ncbi:hypothetical protein HanIR_Chr02g0082211 [Helianthus annuus]|nr:hypothetical protein HanIR_Chr02g0082211 [Helianthus annuus]
MVAHIQARPKCPKFAGCAATRGRGGLGQERRPKAEGGSPHPLVLFYKGS